MAAGGRTGKEDRPTDTGPLSGLATTLIPQYGAGEEERTGAGAKRIGPPEKST